MKHLNDDNIKFFKGLRSAMIPTAFLWAIIVILFICLTSCGNRKTVNNNNTPVLTKEDYFKCSRKAYWSYCVHNTSETRLNRNDFYNYSCFRTYNACLDMRLNRRY